MVYDTNIQLEEFENQNFKSGEIELIRETINKTAASKIWRDEKALEMWRQYEN